MLTNRHLTLAALMFVLCVSGFAGFAQDRPAEATPSVPALESFHEVIFKIWHEAWPKKNTAMLRQLVPDVEKGISEVAAAPLPGILRDRKAAWDQGVQKLQAIGSEYKAAASAQNDAALLDAAESLHSQFEALARTIRPALKELDDFHAVLYMLYHHYLPRKDLENVRSASAELNRKMAVLNSAQLPTRLKQKDPEFRQARLKLSASVEALQTAVQTNAEAKIKEAVNVVHSDYQALDRVFQ